MSAFSRDLPTGFDEALRLAQAILSRNLELVERGSLLSEAEQIVVAAYRRATGKSLSRVELYTRLADRLPEAAGEQVIVLASGRAEGKLLQHLTGTQFFYEHEYDVGPDVLVPRPETEVLVARALAHLGKGRSPQLGLEIGLGSGCISIELLASVPELRMVSSELSIAASTKARENANRILQGGAGRLEIIRAETALSVWEPFSRVLGDRRADFLVSNPPYLVDASEADVEVLAHEPREALFSPEQDPVYFYRMIALRAEEFVKPGGRAWLELAHERASVVLELFKDRGWQASLIEDLTGRPRVLEATLPKEF